MTPRTLWRPAAFFLRAFSRIQNCPLTGAHTAPDKPTRMRRESLPHRDQAHETAVAAHRKRRAPDAARATRNRQSDPHAGGPGRGRAVGLAATLERLVATGRITEEEAAAVQQSANASRAADSARLAAAIEGITVNEAQSVLSSQEFAQLRAAYLAGQESTVTIGGRIIQYEPNIPPSISAMTDFKGNGFSIGPGAFATPQETKATILQELYRLNTTEAGAIGVHSGESSAVETAAARAFAKKILQLGVMVQ
jgi:hypothetical protein